MANYTPPTLQRFPLKDDAAMMHRIRLGMVEFRDRTTFRYNAGPAQPYVTGATTHEKGAIYLPVPDNVQIAYGPTWDFVDLDLAAFAIHGGFNKDDMKTSFDAVGGAQNAGELASAIGSIPGVKQLIDQVAHGIGVDETADAAALGFRKAFNPFKEAIFRGVANRTFAFSWNLFPRNEEECNAILEILKALKWHSSPALSQNTVLFDYPGEFTVNFLTNGEDNKYLPKIGYCVCSGIDTNFTSAGVFAAFKNGHPVDISLSIAFTETEIVTKSKVEAGY